MQLRTHVRRTALAVASAALVLGTLPAIAAPASAATDDTDHLVLLDRTAGARQPATWTTGDGTSLTPLTPGATHAAGIDVSNDGNTWVAALRTGGASQDPADSTFALVLVRRVGDTTTTRVLASYFDATPPVISRSGLSVWWMANGNIYRHNVSAGTTTLVTTSLFRPSATEAAVALAVSPDGLKAAVVYQSDSGSRIRAASFDYYSATATKPYFAQSTVSTTRQHAIDPLTWLDNSRLLYGFYDIEPEPNTTTSYVVDVVARGTAVEQADIAGRYAVRYNPDAAGGTSWWTWKDLYTDTTLDGSVYAEVASPTAAVAGAAEESFPLGTSTSNYVPANSAPPVQNATASNRATATAFLYMSGNTVGYNKRLAYLTFASYLTPLPGQTSSAALANFKGTLQWSTNPTATTPVWTSIPTSGETLIPWGSLNPDPTFNGTTPYLTRNTWFRWLYPGDAYTTRDWTDGTLKVTVRPDINVYKTARTASGTIKVYGSATRTGGTAVLQRLSNGSWGTVATTTMTSTGVYSFGYRALRAGSYRVQTLASTSWGAGVKNFTI